MLRRVVSFSLLALLAACAAPEREPGPRLTASEGRARVASLLPKSLGDRTGWATDIYAALASLGVEPSAENICGVIAITEQESGFRADPAVANLATIAWKEIERQREKLGIPSLVLQAALALDSSDGRSYRARIDAVKTEHELSNIYEEIIDRVPLGRRLLADRNPVRTGGPMQVAIAFAQAHAKRKSYPYPVAKTIREEVFTRRGGLYFGAAHLLDYPADYDAPLYRFADFNAGQYASRNAALQKAITELTGLPLELDGDLVTRETKDGSPGTTERAARQLASRLGMSAEQIRGDLELESSPDLPRSRLYRRVFEMAEAAAGKPMPRAVIPQIKLSSPKITRNLTTEWFAKRVETRHRACMRQGGA